MQPGRTHWTSAVKDSVHTYWCKHGGRGTLNMLQCPFTDKPTKLEAYDAREVKINQCR